ncbi:MAG: tRNA (guanosine(37)-N1)-methyltransferase TrmD [Parachlamydiales bacterium]|jgi:tRNA (guanine37-N1)-methyltransferase
MQIDILSLFPGCFQGPFDESMIKRAKKEGLVRINLCDIRQFAKGKHRKVDERPFGGGPGMVLMAPPVCAAIRNCKKKSGYVVYLSPQGRLLDSRLARKLSRKKHLLLLCGHYEGIDERIIKKEVDLEVSIGDYVLTSGCLPAMVLVDAVLRFLPGFLGHPEAASSDSFEKGLFKGPQYTRPLEFEGEKVPEVLLSGHHEKIARWRFEEGRKKTKKIRLDLYQNYLEQVKKKEKDCESTNSRV